MRAFFLFLFIVPSLAFAIVTDQSLPIDVCAHHLSIGEVPSSRGSIITTAPVFKTRGTRMPSDTRYAILLAYRQRATKEHALYYLPVDLRDLIRFSGEPQKAENIQVVIITPEQMRREVVVWIANSIGEVQMTIEKKVIGNSLEQTITYGKFKLFSQ